MRGLIPGLEVPSPLGFQLPSLYHDDDFAQRFSSAIDEVFAPIVCTLDNLSAYLDPMLAPDDFVDWLAGWVGLVIEQDWPEERKRTLIAHAGDLYQWRGTVRGIKALVEAYAGATPEVEESGAVAWSAMSGSAIPGTDRPTLAVRITIPEPTAAERARLTAIVASVAPAHVPVSLVVVSP